MQIYGAILSFLVGYSILNTISFRFSMTEKLGLSFLLGISLQTVLMLFMDMVNIPLTIVNISIVSIIAIGVLNIKTVIKRKVYFELQKERVPFPTGINLVCLVFFVAIVCLEYMNWVKCMYYPTFDRDSLAGFDTIGWIISKEHTLKGLSIFDPAYMPRINNAGSYITYIPMVQLSYAYIYSLGAESSKLIPALIYLCFLISFYGAIRQLCGDTGAVIATFFTLITPEMISFSSLSGTNVIHATYASLGVIYTILWLKTEKPRFFILAIVLMAGNVWARNEGIVFIGAAVIVLFISSFRKREFNKIILYGALSVSPLLIWGIFMKLNNLYAENVIIMKPYFNAEKIQIIWVYFKDLCTDFRFGLSFLAFAFAIFINIKKIIFKKDMLDLLGIIVLSFIFYGIVIYQIEYKWDSIENVLSYSAKRFFFCFIPLLWFYVFSSYWVKKFFLGLERKLSFMGVKQV